jgi:hypothetical protein
VYVLKLVFQGKVRGFSVDLRSFGEFLLLRRSPVVAHVVHALSPAMAPLDAGLDLCFWFRVFYFIFLGFSHSLPL